MGRSLHAFHVGGVRGCELSHEPEWHVGRWLRGEREGGFGGHVGVRCGRCTSRVGWGSSSVWRPRILFPA
eukprot:12101939-Alexandrium_andersonii.AAC.1